MNLFLAFKSSKSIMLVLLLPAVDMPAVFLSLARACNAVRLVTAKAWKDPRQRKGILLVGVPFVLIWNWGGESTSPNIIRFVSSIQKSS